MEQEIHFQALQGTLIKLPSVAVAVYKKGSPSS